jgi:hypothetical protein
MRTLRIVLVSSLIVTLSAPAAMAGDLAASIAKASEDAAEQAQQQETPQGRIPKGYLIPGAALFIGGMAVGINGFLNNSNGKFPEFGEAESTDIKMGTVGLVTAFAGGALLFLGKKKGSRSPSITFAPGAVGVTQQLSW